MIQIWIGNVSPLASTERYREYYDKIPRWRQEKAARYTHPEDRMRSVGAWVLREKMREYYDLTEDVSYNLSHSGQYVMCAMSDEDGRGVKVGCDIEYIRSLKARSERRFCGDEEYEWLSNLPKEEQEAATIRLWVLKESFAKAVREGLRIPFDQIVFDVKNDEQARLLACPKPFAGDYSVQEYKMRGKVDGLEYRLAVCSTSSEISREIREVIL